MDILECIKSKRSVRSYMDKQVEDEIVQELIRLGTLAANGSNNQPWGFVIIQGKDEINELAKITKEYILSNMDKNPYFEQYSEWLNKESSSVLNHASTLLIIYGNPSSHWYVYDGSLAAANIMLAAHSMNIGSCWIGFAERTFNTPEFKAKYGVPPEYELVCPLTLGYMTKTYSPPKRREPVIFSKP